MLLTCLGQSPQIECRNENDPAAFSNYRLRDHATIRRLILRSRAGWVVFKPICDSQWATRILEAFPDGRAIWVYRHYTDVVNSSLRQFKEHARYLHYILHDRKTAGWRAESVSDADMTLIREHYARGISDPSARALIWYLRNVQFFQQRLDFDDRIRLACYEAIVRAPETELGVLFAHLGIEAGRRLAHSVFRTSIHKHDPPVVDPLIATLCDGLFNRLAAARAQRRSADQYRVVRDSK
jgi:hypothetical protein